MQKTIYFIRHGETDYNKNRIIQGSGIDSTLNATGIAQAEAFYKVYKDLPFDAVLTSTLKRTQETVASFINTGLRWQAFADINEMSWGIYEGKSGTVDMRTDYLRVVNAWKSGQYDVGVEGGETAQELGDRVSRFVSHLKTRPEELLLVCSHGRCMRALMCILSGQPLSQMEDYRHTNTGLYKVQFEKGDFHFQLENDIRHLETHFTP